MLNRVRADLDKVGKLQQDFWAKNRNAKASSASRKNKFFLQGDTRAHILQDLSSTGCLNRYIKKLPPVAGQEFNKAFWIRWKEADCR